MARTAKTLPYFFRNNLSEIVSIVAKTHKYQAFQSNVTPSAFAIICGAFLHDKVKFSRFSQTHAALARHLDPIEHDNKP